MHDEFVFDEIKGIGFRFEGIFGHFSDEFFAQTRELVNVLASVLRVGDAEPELKVERLQQLIAKEVALDHAEAVDGTIAHRELHGSADGLQSDEGCAGGRDTVERGRIVRY